MALVRITAWVAYGLLLLPIVLVIGASFTAERLIAFPPNGLSLQWYRVFLDDRAMVGGLLLSVGIALVTVAIGEVLGLGAALYLVRPGAWAREALSAFFLSPLSVPVVLTGFALLVLLTSLGLVNTVGLVIGHVVITVPYIIRTLLSSLALSDPTLQRAAAILGANPWQVFWHVLLPLMRPGLVAGAVFAFLTSFNNITISAFVASPGSTPLPVVIFSRMENLIDPSVAAASSVVIVVTALLMLLLDRRYSLFGSLLR